MKKILLVITISSLICSFVYAEPPTIRRDIRDSSGRLVYKTTSKGNKTEFRSPTGKLLMKSKTTGNITEIRNPSGRLVEKIKTK